MTRSATRVHWPPQAIYNFIRMAKKLRPGFTGSHQAATRLRREMVPPRLTASQEQLLVRGMSMAQKMDGEPEKISRKLRAGVGCSADEDEQQQWDEVVTLYGWISLTRFLILQRS
jgi:hypothetical protein